jgi:TetR/AcrR family transcriptional repressor of nem operon
MRKGERTRQAAIERAADAFSLRGYIGTTLGDLREATGLEKGGIYNHFSSKEELALAAFDFAFEGYRQRFRDALADKREALPRLHAVIDVFRGLIENPLLPGGCLVLNTAVEADDTHPALREKAKHAVDEMQAMVERIVASGIRHGELRADVDGPALATLMIATLEGGVMLSKLYGDFGHMHRAADHLEHYLQSFVAQA